MRKVTAVVTAAAATFALAAFATPAQAATGNTTVALTIIDGTLAIAVTPVAAGASSTIVDAGRVITAPLGLTTVTDTRALSTGWSMSASTTDFTSTVITPTVTIPASAATFSLTAAPTNLIGGNTYSATATTTPTSGALTTASASGINTATMTPDLHVAVQDTATAALYTGTVTQSVV